MAVVLDSNLLRCFASSGTPPGRGLYLCRLKRPVDRTLPAHPYALLAWSGEGSDIDLPRRWGDPATLREIPDDLIDAWAGPLHPAGEEKEPSLVRRPARRQARFL